LSDQGRGTPADVAEDLFVRQRRAAELRERRVDRKGQVEFGIDQRAVQIKDQRANFGKTADGVPLWRLALRSLLNCLRAAAKNGCAAEILIVI
jgi:hypothetical protein